jgi:hypothetical protein
MKNTIVIYAANGAKTVWSPTTLDEMKKDEQYLESVIAETPELLRLDTRQTGVYGPYAVFRQLRFATPQSREIIPDILLLSASGDVVVVEVKRSSNPELRDRRVIAQAIDYAASLSALSEKELAGLFSQGREDVWISLVNFLFQSDKDPEELAAKLLSNIRAGKLHVIVACDKAPVGLYELAKSVSVQSYLSFSLDVLEITPFLPGNGAADPIMFVPNIRLSTEIVARTAITVTYQQGSPEPSVSISTTGIDEIEENLAVVSRVEPGRINWDEKSFFSNLEKLNLVAFKPTKEIYEWGKARNLKLMWGTGVDGGFGLAANQKGNAVKIIGLEARASYNYGVRVYFQVGTLMNFHPFKDKTKMLNILVKLNQIPGIDFNKDILEDKTPRYPGFPISSLQDEANMKQFLDLMGEIVDEIESDGR